MENKGQNAWNKYKQKNYSITGDTQTATSKGAAAWYQYKEKNGLKQDTSSVQSWLESSQNYLNDAQKYLGSYRVKDDNDQEYQQLMQRNSALLAEAYDWRNQLADNEEMVASVNDVISALSNSRGSFQQYFDYYSQWETEDDYNTAVRYDGYNKKYSGQSYDNIQKALSTLEDGEERWWLAQMQHELYQNDKAYMSKSTSGLKSYEAQKVAEQEKEDEKSWFENALASFARTGDTTLPAANMTNVTAAYRDDTSYREPSDLWTEGEKREFGYLYAEDPKKAYAYAEQVNRYYTDKAEREAQVAAGDNASKDFWSGALNTAGAIATAPLGVGLADWLDNIAEYSARGTITNDGYLSPNEYFNAATSGIANELNEKSGTFDEDLWMIGGKGLGDLYSLGVSGAQSIASSLAFGGPAKMAGKAMGLTGKELLKYAAKEAAIPTLVQYFGMGAASGIDDKMSSGYTDEDFEYGSGYYALKQGATPEQAMAYGTIMGAMEGIAEALSVDNLIKVGSASTFKNWLLSSLNQGLGELQEEGITSVVDAFVDHWIMADKSKFSEYVQKFTDAGAENPKLKALIYMAGDVAFDAMGGFATGFGNAATNSAVNTGFDARRGNTQNIQAIKDYGEYTDALIQEGLESDKKSESYKLAQKYQQQVQGVEAKDGKKGKEGKALTGYQIRNLLAANQEQIAPKDLKKIQAAAETRLTALGQTEDVAKVAELATKYATGQKMSKADKKFLASSKYGSRVANELMPQNIASGDYSTEWAEEIGTEQVNKAAYNKKALVQQIVDAMASFESPAQYKALTDRTDATTRFSVSQGEQATVRSTGEAFDINNAEVAAIKPNEVTFKMSDGNEVSANDIDFADENQSFLVAAVSGIENITPAAASAVMHDVVDTSKPLGNQLNGIDEAYTYGFNGYSVEDLKAGSYTGSLTETQLMSAYQLGQSARKVSDVEADAPVLKMRTAAEANRTAEQKAAQQKTRIESDDVEVYFEDGGRVVKFDEHAGKYDDKRMAAVNTAKFLSKLGIGGKYYFFESYENAAGERVYKDASGNEVEAPNCMYMDSDGSIHIDLNAGNAGQGIALFTLGHELTHFVKSQSKKQFKILGDLVTEAFDKTDMSMHDRVVAKQDFLSQKRGYHVTYSDAFEEVVADAMSTMISDGSFHEKIMEIKVKDKGLFDAIKRFFDKMIAKFRKVYENLTPDQRDAQDIRQMKDMFDKIQTAFAEALVEASDNFLAVEAEAVESLGENAKVETNAHGELLLAANERGNVLVYSERTYLDGGREKLEMALRQNGHTDAEIKDTLSYVDDALDYIKILAAGYAKNMGYTNLSDHLVADIVTNVKTGKQVMSAIVNNGDYPVNIDLSLICKKRVAYMNLMSRLIRDGVFDKVNYGGAAIAEVNEILRENGFETACLGCFVESRRLQFQTWAETIVSEWNAEVDKRNPNAENFGFAKGKMESLTDENINELTRELESVKKNDQGNVNLGQGNSVTRMGRLLDALPSLQKKLTIEDLLTPEGLTALRKHDGSLFSIVKSRYGAASPKIVQDFNPYAGEIAMLTFAQVKGITNNAVKGAQAYVTEVKREYGKLKKNTDESKADFNQRKKDHEQKIQDEAMRRYLYDIGGARIQSFSDFMIENVFDYIQIFADLAAKRLPLHGYSKEIVAIRLFGMTGAKWNGSLIAHVERSMGKELAGLLPAGTKDGIPVTVDGKDYVIGFDDYARNAATGGKSFIQSIGMKDIVALQLDPRYSPYVGSITIGVSDAQILAMLDSPVFRMVIPYHASGMLPQFAKLVGVDMYNDYTDYQNTTVRQYYDLNGNAVTELKNAKGETVKADTSFAFNAEIQKTKDAKTAADNYLKWCAQRHEVYDGSKLVGYATFNPKFSSSPYGNDFTRHENYYKLLEDFNTYDCVTEESTVQGAVTMNFPSEENRLTAQQMDAYKQALRDTGIFSEKDIEKYAKNADMTFKEIINAEVGNRANYAAAQAPKWEATVKAVEEKLQKDYARDEKRSDRITLSMTDEERAAILSKKSLIAGVYEGQAEGAIKRNKADLDSGKIGLVKSALVRIGDEFGIFTDYDIADVDVKIQLSKSNIKESVSKDITPVQIAKLLPVLKTAVENAIGIESHANRYFYDDSTVFFENLLGGYVDGEYFVPVRFGLKHSTTGEATLYVIVDQQPVESKKIKAEVVKIPGTQSVLPEISRSAFKVSVADLAPFVNGKDLLRYLPDNMLSNEQKKTKWEAIAETIKKTNYKNDAKYAEFIASGNLRAAQNMVNQAANEAFRNSVLRDKNGRLIKVYHGSHEKFNVFRGKEISGVGNYFSPWKSVAAGYGDTRAFYLNLTDPVMYDYDWNQVNGVQEDKADGFIYVPEDMEDGIDQNKVGDTEIVVYDSNKIKSADPVTYDDNGNVIPLSERFKQENEDIRYSERTGESVSNRSLLASAFEGISRNSIEYQMIQDYKGHVEQLNELETELHRLNTEIRKIRFGKGEYDAEKLDQFESKAGRIAKDINRYDKRLLNMEASEPLRKVIERERKKEAQKTKAHVKEIQENKKVRAEQAELRHKIRKAVRDLDKVLNRGNKKLNVKEDMQNVVTKALKAADILFTDNYGNYDMLRNGIGADMSDSEEALVKTCAKMLKDLDAMPTDGYDNWQARQEAEKQLRTKMAKLKDVFARERKRLNNTTVSSVLGELADAYASLEKSEQSYVQGAYTEAVHNFLKSLQSEVGGTIVKDMTKDQLESVYAAYKMVLTTVRKANQMFNEDLKQTREQLGNAVIQEVIKAGGTHGLWTKGEIAKNQADWNNLKPIWVANRIGSDTFGKLMNGLFKGQYNFAVDVEEAKQFKQSMDQKYKPRDWDTEKLYEFESSTESKFSLNLQQIMSIYAFSKREQAYSHLLNGGFVFESNSTVVVDKKGIKRTYLRDGATSYKLNVETLGEIINTLTAEQKAYVDEMQAYLSDVMGAKGNEVSMKLYGIRMFKEKFYFPLRSSGAYMERAKEAELKKEQGQINLVNSGFTHSVKPEAKNPIVLSGFLDVWAEHCNEMSMYHSMVLPMEDFRKVYNYSTIHAENAESASVYQTIQDAYGKAATNYIDQLYRELNAGATVDPRETPFKAWVSKFKKAAVMLSASVVVQQFSSVGRAFALIDPDHFAGAKVNSGTGLSAADEMKKYAPVAIIKEMGGFDTGTKGSAKSYIMAEQYNEGERLKGFVKDEQYRSEIMGYLPAKADEVTWVSIWEAVKREIRAKHPKMDVKSEQFLALAGERFSEIIEKTQVYDSVLARSANMRSKGIFMSMATAFMAEPTTTINLLEDALRGRSTKKIARTFGAVAVSIVLNNALASIVYAMRDDDEDETFIEKYFQSFTSGMIDDFNPMSYYPFLKDVYSLFQGYDVERADMSVIADLRDAVKKLIPILGKDTSEMDDAELAAYQKQLYSGLMSFLDAGCSALGVPVKNVRRDANAIINTFKTVRADLNERDTTWRSFWDKVGAAAKDTVPVFAWTSDRTKQDKLYDAIMAGDAEYVSRLKSGYKTDSSYQSAVRKALRENDPRIHEAAVAWNNNDLDEYMRIAREIIAEKRFVQDDVVTAIRSEASSIAPDPDAAGTSKAKGLFTADKFASAIAQGDNETARAIRADVIQTAQQNGKTKAEAERSFQSTAKGDLKEAYIAGTIAEATAISALVNYCGENREKAEEHVDEWAFQKKYGFSYDERKKAYISGEISASEMKTVLINMGGLTEENAELQVQAYDWNAEGYEDATVAAVRNYIEYCAEYNVPKDVYMKIRKFSNNTENDVDKETGNTINYSAMKRVMAEIHKQDLTAEQKTAIAKSLGWSSKNIRKYKLW